MLAASVYDCASSRSYEGTKEANICARVGKCRSTPYALFTQGLSQQTLNSRADYSVKREVGGCSLRERAAGFGSKVLGDAQVGGKDCCDDVPAAKSVG